MFLLLAYIFFSESGTTLFSLYNQPTFKKTSMFQVKNTRNLFKKIARVCVTSAKSKSPQCSIVIITLVSMYVLIFQDVKEQWNLYKSDTISAKKICPFYRNVCFKETLFTRLPKDNFPSYRAVRFRPCLF